MKLPRDLSGDELAKALARLGYIVDRQTGSHIRLSVSGYVQPRFALTILTAVFTALPLAVIL